MIHFDKLIILLCMQSLCLNCATESGDIYATQRDSNPKAENLTRSPGFSNREPKAHPKRINDVGTGNQSDSASQVESEIAGDGESESDTQIDSGSPVEIEFQIDAEPAIESESQTENESQPEAENEIPASSCSDEDGICLKECMGLDADCIDVDRDGLTLAEELLAGTQSDRFDSDDDGFYDGDEIARNTNPLSSQEFPDAYAGLQVIGGDTHQHAATAKNVKFMNSAGYPDNLCNQNVGNAHEHVWCDRVYDRAIASNADFSIITSHGSSINSTNAIEWWTEPQHQNFADPLFGMNPDYQGNANPHWMDYIYPTHPEGFPLWTEAGYTMDEWESLQKCADFKNQPESFLAFSGLEYTAAGAGHRTVLYEGISEKVCHTVPGLEDGCTMGELYQNIMQVGGTINMAHPWWHQPNFNLYDPVEDPKGISDHVVNGIEVVRGSLHEHPNHGYRMALDMGYHVHPVIGGDLHNRHPTGPCADPVAPARTSLCWVTKVERSSLVDAMYQHRCYVAKGKSPTKFSISGRPMGSRLLSSQATDSNGAIQISLDAKRGDGAVFGEWDLIHNGAVVPEFQNMPCESDSTCTFTGSWVPDDLTGYYYIRITHDATSSISVLTAPIWIDETCEIQSLEVELASTPRAHECIAMDLNIMGPNETPGCFDSVKEVLLSGEPGVVYKNSDCSGDSLESIEMWPGEFDTRVYFKSATAGLKNVQLNFNEMTSETNILVSPREPQTMGVTSAQTIIEGDCSPVTIGLYDSIGPDTPVAAIDELDISLSAEPNTLFYGDSDCSSLVTGLYFETGAAQKTIYIKGPSFFDVPHGLIVNMSHTDLQDASQNIEVGYLDHCPDQTNDNLVDDSDVRWLNQNMGACNYQECPEDLNGDGQIDGHNLSILEHHWGTCEPANSISIVGPNSLIIQECSVLTLHRVNENNFHYPASGNLDLLLTTNNAYFFSDSSCQNAIGLQTEVAMASGEIQKSLYMRTQSNGVTSVTATDDMMAEFFWNQASVPTDCPDFNNNWNVGFDDYQYISQHFGDCPAQPADCESDLNGDGVVGTLDLDILFENYGHCPLP